MYRLPYHFWLQGVRFEWHLHRVLSRLPPSLRQLFPVYVRRRSEREEKIAEGGMAWCDLGDVFLYG